MIKGDLLALAQRVAAAHELPAEIVCGMIEREATENQWAVRYEPGFMSKYVAAQYTSGKISVTEAYTRSMSWGLMQIMGQTAREFGFTGAFLSELCDPPIGIEYACRKLTDCLRRAKGDMAAALESYNGGSNPAYGNEVLALAAPYRLTPNVTKA